MRRPIFVALLFSLCVASVVSDLAGAQERLGVSRQNASYPETTPKDSVGPDPAYLSRAIPGFAVGVVGAVAGGALGYALAGKCNKPFADQCEFHGFLEVIVGGFIGGVVGSAFGAAIPAGRSFCTKGERLARGLGGATLGGVVAIGLLLVSTPVGLGVAATVPVGAAVAMRKC